MIDGAIAPNRLRRYDQPGEPVCMETERDDVFALLEQVAI